MVLGCYPHHPSLGLLKMLVLVTPAKQKQPGKFTQVSHTRHSEGKQPSALDQPFTRADNWDLSAYVLLIPGHGMWPAWEERGPAKQERAGQRLLLLRSLPCEEGSGRTVLVTQQPLRPLVQGPMRNSCVPNSSTVPPKPEEK